MPCPPHPSTRPPPRQRPSQALLLTTISSFLKGRKPHAMGCCACPSHHLPQQGQGETQDPLPPLPKH